MWLVKIECMRVQGFLFAVPRLMDILGANTLLGETLRVGLSELATKPESRAGFPPGHPLPNGLPALCPDDPLEKLQDKCDADRDDPKSLYKTGILARDGGHFHALFAEPGQAETFAAEAAGLIRRKLPGLRFTVSPPVKVPPPKREPDADPKTAHLLGLPALQVCEESGRGIASHIRRYPEGLRYLSRSALRRKRRGTVFRDPSGGVKHPARDIASLLAQNFPGRAPKTFEELCGGEYLALIHADGNGIGAWSNRVRDSVPKPRSGDDLEFFLKREARGEQFYHAMRLAVRQAVHGAIKKIFHEDAEAATGADGEAPSINPYRLLMLGGDDLLLACRAKDALRFVHAYAEALASRPALPDYDNGGQELDSRPLTVGVGVAIAKPSFPFHRLHQIAEELASSAKRLTRGERPAQASVVDWAVCTEAWMDEVAMARAGHVVRYGQGSGKETLALSGKPYVILDAALPEGERGTCRSLESLLNTAKTLQTMPRSQRRALVGELRRGRRHAELCARELRHGSPPSWEALRDAGLVADDSRAVNLWREEDGAPGRYVTAYADLVEITELPNLKLGEDRPLDRDSGDLEELKP